ncbi:MAG: translocation/assembly module TamB domain-containing protein [Candidatus Binatia bacterium]
MKSRILRALFWVGTGLFSLIVVVLAAAWIYTQTESFRSLVREHALEALRESVDGEVAFDKLTGSIWRAVQVHGLSVRQDGKEIVSAKVVTIRISLLRQALAFLYSRQLHISEIDIADPAILAVESADREWNLASLLKKKKPDEPETRAIAIFLDRMSIHGGRIEARLANGRVARVNALVVDGNAGLLPTGVKVDVAALDFLLSSEGFPDLRWQSALSFDASGSSPTIDLRRIALRTPKSHIEASGAVKDFAEPVAKLKLELKTVAAEEIKIFLPALPLREDLSGSFTADGPRSALKIAGALAAPDGRLRSSMVVDWSGSAPRFRGEIEAEKFVLEKVFDAGQSGGTINGRGSFSGAGGENLEASTEAQVTDFKLQGWRMEQVKLSGNLKNKKLALAADSRGKAGQTQLRGTADLAGPVSYEFTLKARDFDLQKTADGQGAISAAARVSADLWLNGRGTDPTKAQVEARMNLLPSRIGDVSIIQGEARGNLRDGVLSLEPVRVDAKDTTVTARGKIALFEPKATNQLTYAVRAKEIRPWLALAGLEGGGRIDVDGTAAGALKNPRLEGKAQFVNLYVAGNSFQSGTLNWSLAEISSPKLSGRLKAAAKGVDAGVPLRTLEVNAGLRGKEPTTADVELSAQDREQHSHRIKTEVRYFPDRIESAIQEVSLQLATGVWRNAKPVQVVVRGKTVAVDELLLQRGAESVRAQGVFGLQGNQDFNLQVSQLPLEEFHAFSPLSRELRGQLTGDVKVRGTAQSPVLDGKIRVERLVVAGQSYAGLEGTTAYAGRRARLQLELRQDATHALNATGEMPIDISWGGNRAANVPGEADVRLYSNGLSIAFLGAFSKDIEKPQGNLSMDVRLRGPVKALAPSGQLQLERAQARVPALGVTFTDVDVQTTLAAGKASITRLSARSGQGRLTGSGQLGIAEYKLESVNVTLQAEDFQVINTREYKAGATGKLTMSGSLQGPLVRGDLTLVRTNLQPDLTRFQKKGPPPPDPTITVVKTSQELTASQQTAETVQKKAQAAESPLFQRLGLDVTVRVPHGTWVNLDEGSIDLTGDIRIKKQPGGEPIVSGALQSVRGWYTFQGRKFELERGEVVFTGGGKTIEPRLDIVARYKAADHLVYLVIGGTPKEPTLNLRSEPPLEQADILSVLLFGKPAGELNEGQQNVLQAQAIQATASFVASGLRNSVARKLGVDSLDVMVGTAGTPGKVAVGKYVKENVYVSAAQQLGGEKQQEYSVEYHITPNWQLKGSTESGRNSGVDLFWHKRY